MSDQPPASTPPPSSLPEKDEYAVERRGLRDYYIILRERLWIALPLAILAAAGYGYSQARQVPMYASTATMQFQHKATVVTTEAVVDPSVRSEVDLNTYTQILNSATLRTKVVESLTPDEIKILQRPYLKHLKPGETPPPPGALLGGVSVATLRNSFLISITDQNRDPAGAALVANRYVEEFMEYLMESVGGKNTFAVDFLKNRAAQLEKESQAAQQRLEDYMQRNNLVSLDNSVNIVTDRLKAVNAALTAAQLDLLNNQVAYQQVLDFQKQGKDLLDIAYISQHSAVPVLKSQLIDLRRQQAVLGERYLERHPKMIDIANTIATVQAQLAKAVQNAIDDLKASLAKSNDTVQALQAAYAQNEKEAFRLRALGVEFNSLQSQATGITDSYKEVLNRLNQTTTTKSLDNPPVSPLDRAVAPGGPYAPDLSHITRTCAGLGLVVFCGVAFGLNFLDDRVKSSWDVESFIGVNLLGIIPEINGVKDEDRYNIVLESRPENTSAVEAFLGAYSALKIQSKLDFPKSLLVTSTIPGEGKTLISCNLAASFARHGKATLLIDCDLRRPMLHRHFRQPNDAGLLKWFEAGAALPDDPLTDPNLGLVKAGDNLWLLRSGGRSKSPTQLLESPAFAQLLAHFKRKFDLLVVDSPPLGAVSDGLLLAERTDEIAYVCRFNRAARKHIKLYMKNLHAGKNDVLGIILNGLSPRRIEYYSNYRYYRSYKKYYGTQQ